jgi:NitT/TauT family transport system substrate-binding protein
MSSFYLAHELGYFVEAGLEVEIQQVRFSAEMAVLLAGGELDVSFLAINPSFINAVAKGAKLKIVGGREIASPTCGTVGTVYGHRRSFPQGLADLRWLKGKRIAIVKKASIQEFFLDTLLESVGMSSDDVQVVELRRSEAVAALVGRKIHALLAHSFDKDPASLSSQIVRGSGFSQVLPNFQYTYLVFGQALLMTDATIGAKFFSAYLRGAKEFLEGRTPRFMEEYARSNGLDPKNTREACRNTFTPDGTINLEDLQKFIDWTVRRGYCPEPVKAAQLVDTRFLAEVRRRS